MHVIEHEAMFWLMYQLTPSVITCCWPPAALEVCRRAPRIEAVIEIDDAIACADLERTPTAGA